MKFYLIFLMVVSMLPVDNKTEKMAFQDPDQPLGKRVSDLLSRMTVEEKIGQLVYNAPAVERLGIPVYNWWNEALHGVARAGTATVFPQAIGLAATWNPEIIQEMADVISTEARAKHHEAVRNGEHDIYQGLTFWSPNINIFRDPRWGRGQETYGEDPYLTAQIGIAFVKGLQGDDPKYLKTAACAKHFAVHSGPEYLRHEFDVKVNERDLRETYLPAFEALVKEADVEAVMCAYNRYDGKPCCGSDYLLMKILREEWGFSGHVVSDCWAVSDIVSTHKVTETRAEAAAMALVSGTDLNCGNMYPYLKEALQEGLVSEKDIDRALRRLLRTRFKLGMFDPPDQVRYASISYEKNDAPEHGQLALETARQSIVLLKNENNFLPLSKNLKKIAVIGPNADNLDALLGNYNGTPSSYITPLEGIRRSVSRNTIVSYVKGTGHTQGEFELEAIPAAVLSSENRPGLNGEYFENLDLSGKPKAVRIDSSVNFNWGPGNPLNEIGNDRFSIRWTGVLTPEKSGEYIIGTTADDGVRLFIDDELIIDEWQDQGASTFTKTKELTAGKKYRVRLEYYENGGDALIELGWQEPGKDIFAELMDEAHDADAVVFIGGISPRFEGEEMGQQVQYEGFYRGDRTDIILPKNQTLLMNDFYKMGKQVVLVILSGSAVTVNWEDENIPAIIQAWYPGQAGGQAVADVLFGDYNPSGRLPVTVYKSAAQLPDYKNYDMKGRTYRYFDGEALYPFGYGLSYTTFEYSDLKIVLKDEAVSINVSVKNNGNLDGDEVVQVYISDNEASVPAALKSLKAFKRISLKRGEEKRVSFKLTKDDFALYNEKMERVVEPGDFLILVGGSSAGGLKGLITL